MAISLDGADAATHDAFRGVAGSFARTIEIMQDAGRLELPLQVNTTITAANILNKLFDAYTEVRRRSKGRATEYLMDLTNYGSVMKQLELQKGEIGRAHV